jgi:hypothetical protein
VAANGHRRITRQGPSRARRRESTYEPPPGVTDDTGTLLDAMRDFGEAFNARQAREVRRSQHLISAARGALGHAGVELDLALLKASRIPYPDPPQPAGS